MSSKIAKILLLYSISFSVYVVFFACSVLVLFSICNLPFCHHACLCPYPSGFQVSALFFSSHLIPSLKYSIFRRNNFVPLNTGSKNTFSPSSYFIVCACVCMRRCTAPKCYSRAQFKLICAIGKVSTNSFMNSLKWIVLISSELKISIISVCAMQFGIYQRLFKVVRGREANDQEWQSLWTWIL